MSDLAPAARRLVRKFLTFKALLEAGITVARDVRDGREEHAEETSGEVAEQWVQLLHKVEDFLDEAERFRARSIQLADRVGILVRRAARGDAGATDRIRVHLESLQEWIDYLDDELLEAVAGHYDQVWELVEDMLRNPEAVTESEDWEALSEEFAEVNRIMEDGVEQSESDRTEPIQTDQV